MILTPQDPRTGHSLWLQRRSVRRTDRRTEWRSDWTPFGLVLLLLGLLILLSMFLPSRESVNEAKQAAHDERGSTQQLPMVGVLTEQ